MKFKAIIFALIASVTLGATAHAATLIYSFTGIADTNGSIQFPGTPALNDDNLNDDNDVALLALLDAGGQSINVSSDGILSTVTATGDGLDGLAVASLFPGSTSLFPGPEGFNDLGERALFVSFTDNTQEVSPATIEEASLQAALPLFIAGIAGLWIAGWTRRRKYFI